MIKYVLALLIFFSSITSAQIKATLKDDFGRGLPKPTLGNLQNLNGATGLKWIQMTGGASFDTAATMATYDYGNLTTDYILMPKHKNALSTGGVAYDSALTSLGVEVGVVVRKYTSDSWAATYNNFPLNIGLYSTTDFGTRTGWQVAISSYFNGSYTTNYFAVQSISSSGNISNVTVVATGWGIGDTLIAYIPTSTTDSIYVLKGNARTVLASVWDPGASLGSTCYAGLNGVVLSDNMAFDNFFMQPSAPPPPVTGLSISSVIHSPTSPLTTDNVVVTTRVVGQVDSVWIYVDGATVKTGKNINSHDFTLASTPAAFGIGSHTYSVQAKDSNGVYTLSSTYSFTVTSVTFVNYTHFPPYPGPADLVYISAQVTGAPMDSVKIVRDGTVILNYKANSATSVSVTSTAQTEALGNHSYYIQVKDDAGINTISATKTFTVSAQSAMFLTAYYPGWSIGTSRAGQALGMYPDQVNFQGVSHVVHFGSGPISAPPHWNPQVNISFGGIYNDSLNLIYGAGWRNGQTNYNMLDSLKKYVHLAGAKLLLSMGGIWGYQDTVMHRLTSDSTTCQVFVDAFVGWCQRHGYDGVEIDYEPPGSRAQMSLLTRLTKRKMTQLLGANAPLVMTVANLAEVNYDPVLVDSVAQYLFMMYDMHNPYNGIGSSGGQYDVTGFNAPLHLPNSTQYPIVGTASLNYDGTRPAAPSQFWGPNKFVANGFPKAKIGVGVPFYGYVFDSKNAPNQSAVGIYAQYFNYADVLWFLTAGGVKNWDNTAKVPWAGGVATQNVGWQITSGHQTYVTFDDTASIAEKARWAKNNGFGGMMAYELSDGWVANAPQGQRDPLLRALVNALQNPVTTFDSIPIPPTQASPANNATNQPKQITFRWNKVVNAVTYTFQLAIDTAVTQTIINSNVGFSAIDTAYAISNQVILNDNTKYYWRVSATSTVGTSSWSQVFSFRTSSPAQTVSAQPTLASPANNVTGITMPVTFRWNNINDSTVSSYTFMVVSDTNNASQRTSLATVNDTFYTVVAGLASSSAYYWRVYTTNPIGNSLNSAWRKFTTAAAPATGTGAVIAPVTIQNRKQSTVSPKYITMQDAIPTDIGTPPSGFYNWNPRYVRLADGTLKDLFVPPSVGGSALTTGPEVLNALNSIPLTTSRTVNGSWLFTGNGINPDFRITGSVGDVVRVSDIGMNIQKYLYITSDITGTSFMVDNSEGAIADFRSFGVSMFKIYPNRFTSHGLDVFFMPSGGTANQILKKNSSANGDWSWRTDSTSAGGSADSTVYATLYRVNKIWSDSSIRVSTSEFDTVNGILHAKAQFRATIADSSLIQTGTKVPLTWYAPYNCTITSVLARVVGGSSPSVTIDLKYGTDISASGTSIISSPSATTSTTTYVSVGTITSANLTAGDGIWCTFTAKSGITNVTPTYVEIIALYKGR